MFRWYKLSTICFVFFFDLGPVLDKEISYASLAPCRWFTRGWTLQELIAPKNIEFYDSSWELKGTKSSLQRHLSQITSVDQKILENADLISSICIAKRMSWAARRKTRRVEDLSYCLFGIFDINLPLIYGEGPKTFFRLQEAIAAQTTDLTIFAWLAQVSKTPETQDDQVFHGMFARSPWDFRDCHHLRRDTNPLLQSQDYTMTNKGIHMNTVLRRSGKYYRLDLQCHGGMKSGPLTNPRCLLVKTAAHEFVAQTLVDDAENPELLAGGYVYYMGSVHTGPVYIPKTVSLAESKLLQRRLSHGFEFAVENTSGLECKFDPKPEHLWDANTNTFITNGHASFAALLDITLSRTIPEQFSARLFDVEEPTAWHQETHHCVVLGLMQRTNDHWNSMYGGKDSAGAGDLQQKKVIEPWAKIDLSGLSEDNRRRRKGTLMDELLFGTVEALKLSAQRNQFRPIIEEEQIYKYKPDWIMWQKIPTEEANISDGAAPKLPHNIINNDFRSWEIQLSLDVSTRPTEDKWRHNNMYKAVLKIERSN